MKTHIRQRNEQIKSDYRKIYFALKEAGEKTPALNAIDKLVEKYAVYGLKFGTIKQIVSNHNYSDCQKK